MTTTASYTTILLTHVSLQLLLRKPSTHSMIFLEDNVMLFYVLSWIQSCCLMCATTFASYINWRWELHIVSSHSWHLVKIPMWHFSIVRHLENIPDHIITHNVYIAWDISRSSFTHLSFLWWKDQGKVTETTNQASSIQTSNITEYLYLRC